MVKKFIFMLILLLSSFEVFSSGWHPADEILPGIFNGNYSFNGTLTIVDALISGKTSCSMLYTDGVGNILCGSAPSDTNAATICSGDNTYLDGNGNCDVLSINGGTVTSVNNGSGLIGGPITINGTLSVDYSVVANKSWVNSQGFSTGSHTVDTNTNAATLCSAGQYLDGDGTCKPIPVDTNSGGDITSVIAGTGLTGGGTTGDVTLSSILGTTIEETEIVQNTLDDSEIQDNSLTDISLATGSVTSDEILDNTINEIDLEVTNSPIDNYILSYDSATGGFTWVLDADTNTNAATICGPGQFLNGDGSCDPVPTGDITGVAVGIGLTGGGTSGDLTINFDENYGDSRYIQKNLIYVGTSGSSGAIQWIKALSWTHNSNYQHKHLKLNVISRYFQDEVYIETWTGNNVHGGNLLKVISLSGNGRGATKFKLKRIDNGENSQDYELWIQNGQTWDSNIAVQVIVDEDIGSAMPINFYSNIVSSSAPTGGAQILDGSSNIQIEGSNIATQSWVTSQGYSTTNGDITGVTAGTGLTGGGTSGTVTLSATLGTTIEETEIVQNSLDDSEIQDNSLTAISLATNSVGDAELTDDVDALKYKAFGGSKYDKYCMWGGSTYCIGMVSAMTYGGLNDYAMTFSMSNHATRGWLFRDTSDTQSDGAMSLTTTGVMTVKTSVSSAAFYYNSDKRLKENITKIDSSLEKIKKLEGVEFNWNESKKRDIGLIAQNVEQTFPELVITDNQTGLKSVEYANLVAPLIEAVKEQQKQIDELKKEIEKLKNKQ